MGARLNRGQPGAFTLIELLVVIGILVLLAAIVAPVAGRMHRRQARLACAAHLRQIGVAAAAYAVDNRRALPRYYQSGSMAFDTFLMRRENGELVNLGLLSDYVRAADVFYCPSQTAETSADIGYDTPENRWHNAQGQGGGAGARGRSPRPQWAGLAGWRARGTTGNPARAAAALGPPPRLAPAIAFGRVGPTPAGGGPDAGEPGRGPDPPPGVNSSFPARSREHGTVRLPAWTLPVHANKVIYSDFIGVDDMPGRGRFRRGLQAPHDGEGCYRLFGDGSVSWADAAAINAFRPVTSDVPSAGELHGYYELMDVLP